MPKILFIEHNGAEHLVEAECGKSVMQTAVENVVPGILGDCGGSCSCATCHAYVDPRWLAQLPPASEEERLILEGALEQRDNSRLSCQIKVSEALDGMVLRLPERQF